MNTNTLIGLILLGLLLGGGYYASKKSTPLTKTSSTTETPATKSPVSSTPKSTQKPDAPVAQTGNVTTVSSSTAVVTGQVTPNGALTTYWFEYGETTAFGSRTTAQEVGSGYTLTPTPAYITGLRSNTVYYYRLSAKNNFATVNGATYNFQTNTTPPVKVMPPTTQTINATDISRTGATLRGQVNPNGFATNYWFEYGQNGSLGNATNFQSVGGGTTGSLVSFSLSGLAPFTKYYFRLNAQNVYGTVNGTILNFVTQGPPAPSAPTVSTTNASSVGNSTATLNGRINPNGASTTYWFEYSEDSLLGTLIGSGTPQQMLSEGNNTANVKASLTGLARNTRYYYRALGQNAYGVIRGDIESFKTR